MSKVTGKNRPLRIAIASGKGGTGKTTIVVALAQTAKGNTILLDCDVEEPNAAIFLSQEQSTVSVQEEDVCLPMPQLDESLCTGCGACAAICRFNAIIMIKKQVTIFNDLCHSCGGCALVCPEKAITEIPRKIGKISEWKSGSLRFIQGKMDVGHAMSPPLIRAVKKKADVYENDPLQAIDLTLIDCPPRTSCPVVTAVRDTDFVLLVTEASPFGLHDLKLAVLTMRKMRLPIAVVINRSDSGDKEVSLYCKEEGIPVLAQIPNDRRVAETYSSGGTLLSIGSPYTELMQDLLKDMLGLIAKEKSV